MSGVPAKADIEHEMLHAWEALGSAVDSFSEAEMDQDGVIEGWSVKDLLGHIAFWADKAAATSVRPSDQRSSVPASVAISNAASA